MVTDAAADYEQGSRDSEVDVHRPHALFHTTLVTTLVLLAGCGGAGSDAGVTTPGQPPGTSGALAPANGIAVRDNVFSPSTAGLARLDTVAFPWCPPGPRTHRSRQRTSNRRCGS